jgi:hypothetical protein
MPLAGRVRSWLVTRTRKTSTSRWPCCVLARLATTTPMVWATRRLGESIRGGGLICVASMLLLCGDLEFLLKAARKIDNRSQGALAVHCRPEENLGPYSQRSGAAMKIQALAGLLVVLFFVISFWKGLPQFAIATWNSLLDWLGTIIGDFLPTVFSKRHAKVKIVMVKPSEEPPKWTIIVRYAMAVLVSLVMGGYSIRTIYSTQTDSTEKKWACGMVGTIVGYWLK